jgi:hypothetical protein
MVSIHGYENAYSALAESDIPDPLTYFKFWTIPEGYESPEKLKKYMEYEKKKSIKNSSNNLDIPKLKKMSSMMQYISSNSDYKLFYELLCKFPLVYDQINEYKGSVFLFKNTSLIPNRYDTFQIENMVKYHITKTILYFDQLKNKMTRVKTLLDNQFAIIDNKPVRAVGSQYDTCNNKGQCDCTTLVPTTNGKWIEYIPQLNQGVFNVIDADGKEHAIEKIIECDNGLIYCISDPLSISYYQF